MAACADQAGNTASQEVKDIRIDLTPPVVTVTGVSNGASYPLGSVPTAGCTTTDALSGVQTMAASAVSGGNPDGTGAFTATCSGALDQAGNPAAPVSVSYTVTPLAYPFSGFFQPVDNPPTVNTVKAGSAIPIKFSLGGDRGLAIFAPGSPTSRPVSCSTSAPVDSIEQTTTAGTSSLSYDPITQQYTYVWKTDKAWAKTCRVFTFTLTDGTTHTANFSFLK
jgi:hypothetical protein